MSKGHCADATRCKNAGKECDRCTHNWTYESRDDWFEEKEEEEV